MRSEKPAEGILRQGDYGDSKYYLVNCDCGNPDCSHEIEVEADDFGVQVHISVTSHTKWWKRKRWAQIWQIITKGYAEMQTTIVLNEQTALNYSDTLKSAIKDVKTFRDNRKIDKQTKE